VNQYRRRSRGLRFPQQEIVVMSEESEVCWGVKGFWIGDTVFGPFESEEQARAYMHSERFENLNRNPEDHWVLRFSGTNPVHVMCQAGFEWTRSTMPQFRDPDTRRIAA
jgi:hypothetical protein